MNEIKETIAILKARWPEVFLIVGIQALSMFGSELFPQVTHLRNNREHSSDRYDFLTAIV